MSRERKFTPGPWYFDMAVDAYNKGKETFAIYSHPAEGHTVEIIETPDHYGDDCVHGRDVTEKMANANLIAAAPTMLNELEIRCAACRRMTGPLPEQCDNCGMNSAIKKAYGETK